MNYAYTWHVFAWTWHIVALKLHLYCNCNYYIHLSRACAHWLKVALNLTMLLTGIYVRVNHIIIMGEPGRAQARPGSAWESPRELGRAEESPGEHDDMTIWWYHDVMTSCWDDQMTWGYDDMTVRWCGEMNIWWCDDVMTWGCDDVMTWSCQDVMARWSDVMMIIPRVLTMVGNGPRLMDSDGGWWWWRRRL